MPSDYFEIARNETATSVLTDEESDQGFVKARNHAYGGASGYIYTSHSIDRSILARRSVSITLTATYGAFEVVPAGTRALNGNAVVIQPLVPHALRAAKVGIVAAIINPDHPKFRIFSTAPCAKVVALNRANFSALDDHLWRAYLGQLDRHEAESLLEEIAEVAARNFPAPKPLSARVAQAVELLRSPGTVANLESLAQRVGISYYRLSHAFSEQMGLPLRSYQLWRKLDDSWSGIRAGKDVQTIALESGFVDAAHFCRVFRAAYGAPLTYVLNKVSCP